MEIIVKTIAGSHLFGTDTPSSDMDYKGVFMPSGSEILLGEYKDSISESTGSDFSKNTKDDVDTEMYSLRKFLKMLRNGDTAAIELLFTPDSHIVEKSSVWDEIVRHRDQLVSRKINSLIGYARQQSNKYGIKGSRMGELSNMISFLKDLEKEFDFPNPKLKHGWEKIQQEIKKYDHVYEYENEMLVNQVLTKTPSLNILGKKFDHHTSFANVLQPLKKVYKNYGQRAREAKNNNGVDFKALSHAVRVCLQGIELMKTGKITLPHSEDNKKLLIDIKTGKLHYTEVAEIIEANLEELEKVTKTSQIREEVDKSFADGLIIHLHLGAVYEYVQG